MNFRQKNNKILTNNHFKNNFSTTNFKIQIKIILKIMKQQKLQIFKIKKPSNNNQNSLITMRKTSKIMIIYLNN